MPADRSHVLELRRRVQSDPSSIAFAQLGEELRRIGACTEAVEVCRVALTHHPAPVSARVTLGRALFQLRELEEARHELFTAVEQAGDDLTAVRALAEVHRECGESDAALAWYRRALALAPHDAALAEVVTTLEAQISRGTGEQGASGEALFDFDRLVEQLRADTPPAVQALDAFAAGTAAVPLPRVLTREFSAVAAEDPFERLEAELRERERRGSALRDDGPLSRQDEEALAELECWLDALQARRA